MVSLGRAIAIAAIFPSEWGWERLGRAIIDVWVDSNGAVYESPYWCPEIMDGTGWGLKAISAFRTARVISWVRCNGKCLFF